MLISEIREADKKRNRIQLEDGRSFVLYKGECRRLGLEECMDCAPELLDEIYGDILKGRARKRALHLLERMDYTRAQLERKLTQGGYPKEVAEDAVDYAAGFHYVDDERYARNYVGSHRDKKSRAMMRAELLSKGIGQETADRVLEECCGEETDREVIGHWLEKKRYSGETEDPAEKQRVYRSLVRKGFRPEDVLREMERREGKDVPP